MHPSLTSDQIALVQECLDLVLDPRRHAAATDAFEKLQKTLTNEISKDAMLEILWKELLAARRSALFWEQISDSEKEISDRMAQSHLQLQQNYLRLIQEQ